MGKISKLGWIVIGVFTVCFCYNNISSTPFRTDDSYEDPPTIEIINLGIYGLFVCSNFVTSDEARVYILR